MDKELLKTIFMVYLFGILVSVNFFFLIFVHYYYDLTPNLALAILTIPPALIILVEIFKKKSKGGTKNAKIN